MINSEKRNYNESFRFFLSMFLSQKYNQEQTLAYYLDNTNKFINNLPDSIVQSTLHATFDYYDYSCKYGINKKTLTQLIEQEDLVALLMLLKNIDSELFDHVFHVYHMDYNYSFLKLKRQLELNNIKINAKSFSPDLNSLKYCNESIIHKGSFSLLKHHDSNSKSLSKIAHQCSVKKSD